MPRPYEYELLTTTVRGCARCGETHVDLRFKKFTGRPVVDEDGAWDFWAPCPACQDPILLRNVKETTIT